MPIYFLLPSKIYLAEMMETIYFTKMTLFGSLLISIFKVKRYTTWSNFEVDNFYPLLFTAGLAK